MMAETKTCSKAGSMRFARFEKTKALKIAACLCFSLAVIVAGIGLVATAQLIKEYGENVSPLVLTAQAAVLWVPLAGILATVGYLCVRNVPRQ